MDYSSLRDFRVGIMVEDRTVLRRITRIARITRTTQLLELG